MRSDKRLYEIIMDIWRQAYKEALPSVDLDKLIKDGKTKSSHWYMDYYLPDARYKEIVELHFKRNKVTPMERKHMTFEVYLGAGPSGVKKKC